MIYSADVVRALWGGEFAFSGAPQNETEFNSAFMPVSGVDEHGVNVFETDPAKFPVTWAQFSAKRSEMLAAEPMRRLRSERNRRLVETDWWVLSDRTPTQAQLAYRQALRDITNSYASLDNVVWPEKPE